MRLFECFFRKKILESFLYQLFFAIFLIEPFLSNSFILKLDLKKKRIFEKCFLKQSEERQKIKIKFGKNNKLAYKYLKAKALSLKLPKPKLLPLEPAQSQYLNLKSAYVLEHFLQNHFFLRLNFKN